MRTPSPQQRPIGAPARARRGRPRAIATIGVAAVLVLAMAPAAAASPRSHRASHRDPRASDAISPSWFRTLPFLGAGDVRGAAPGIAAASADLTVTVTDAPDPVVVGGSITYTIGVANAGPDLATGTVLTFALAPLTTFTSSTPGPGTCAEVAGVVTCALGDIANGGSTSVSVVVAATAVGTAGPATATVMSAVPDPSPGNATASASTTVTDPADLSTTIDDATTTFTPGTTLTFTMGVSNAGTSAAAAGVVVVGHAPAGTTPHTTDPECVVAGTDVTCTTTAPLAASASKTWQFTLDVPASFSGTTLDSQATISSSPTADPNAANNVATDHDAVAQADLSIAAVAAPDPAVAGEDLTYTITVTNAGPSPVNDAVVTDTVPAGTTFKAAQDGGTQAGGVVTWTLGPLAPNATATVHLVVTVNPNRSTDISNDVSVASAVADPDTADRTTTVVSKVTETAADLTVKTTSSGGPVSVGDVVKFVVVVSNDGPADATGIKIKDDLPKGVTIRSADASDGSFSKTSGMWDLGDLADGHRATLHITGTVNSGAGSSLKNSAKVQAVDQPDPTSSNDDDAVTVRVLGAQANNPNNNNNNGTDTATTTTNDTTTVSGTETLATTGTDASARGAGIALVLLTLGLMLMVAGHRLERRRPADR